MFKRSFVSNGRVDKVSKTSKRSFSVKQKLAAKLESECRDKSMPAFKGPVVSIVVGKEQRLFAVHQGALAKSPYLMALCDEAPYDGKVKYLNIIDEDPATFSCVLEYLYKTDYSPRLLHDRRRNVWYVERLDDLADEDRADGAEAVIYHTLVGDFILRDTAVYCAAERYNLPDLKRLALRKQNLQSNLRVATILRSCQYAYANTPDTDVAIRPHFLYTIIRGRKSFVTSGTLQQEMTLGGKVWFDLFTTMCKHMDDLQAEVKKSSVPDASNTPRTI